MAPPQVDFEYCQQIVKARQELCSIISSKKHYPHLMLRLALHDAGIYEFITADKYLIKKGPNGSIRNAEERDHPSNQGLKEAVDRCDEVKKKCEKITYADLYQLAGVVAVEVSKGPTIHFVSGREDSSSTQCPDEKAFTGNKLDEFIKIFEGMGLEVKDMVALLGGLYGLGEPIDKPSEEPPPMFDNSYFINLETKDPGSFLLKDKFRQHVDKYKEDKGAFFKDYAAAHEKVLRMRAPEKGKATASSVDAPKAFSSVDAPKAASWNRVKLAGIGLAVATTVIILGFFLSRRSK